MILADTSVWLNALSDKESSYRTRILMESILADYQLVLSASVRYDLLTAVFPELRPEFLDYLDYLPILQADEQTWNIAVSITWESANNGIGISQSDSLVVASAIQHKVHLFTFNEKQRKIARLRSLSLVGLPGKKSA
jgi:predicted nucleic acid-binding protein